MTTRAKVRPEPRTSSTEQSNSSCQRRNASCSPGRSASSSSTVAPESRSPMTGSRPYLPPRVEEGGPSHTTALNRSGRSMPSRSYQSKEPYDRKGACRIVGDAPARRARRRFVCAHRWSCSRETWSPSAKTRVVRPEPHSSSGRGSRSIASRNVTSAADGFHHQRRTAGRSSRRSAARMAGVLARYASSLAAVMTPMPREPRASLAVDPR